MATIIKRTSSKSNIFYFGRFLSSSVTRNGNANQPKTHFGFQEVNEEEKEEKVYGVFANVAEKYDVMNDAMSVGVHRLWKDTFVRRLGPRQGIKHLDVAGGTGDIAFRVLNYMSASQPNSTAGGLQFASSKMSRGLGIEPEQEACDASDAVEERLSSMTVCDINSNMLDEGRRRAADRVNGSAELRWLEANAEQLPLEDNSFDSYTIAFGIRNCTHIDKVLREAFRVLRPGGRFMCLEFSRVPNPLIRRFYDEYSLQVIPVMGQVIAGDWDSYQYLVESIRQFPDQTRFANMIREAGFSAVSYENLTFGVVAIHSGFKL